MRSLEPPGALRRQSRIRGLGVLSPQDNCCSLSLRDRLQAMVLATGGNGGDAELVAVEGQIDMNRLPQFGDAKGLLETKLRVEGDGATDVRAEQNDLRAVEHGGRLPTSPARVRAHSAAPHPWRHRGFVMTREGLTRVRALVTIRRIWSSRGPRLLAACESRNRGSWPMWASRRSAPSGRTERALPPPTAGTPRRA